MMIRLGQMARTGRRKPGESVFPEYLERADLHPALRMIAKGAAQRGLSLRALAEACSPKRDYASVQRTFDFNNPQRHSIDVLAAAVGIDALSLHAELDDLNDDDAERALNEAMSFALHIGFKVSNEVARQRIAAAYRSSPATVQKAAARAWVLSSKSDLYEKRLQNFLASLGEAGTRLGALLPTTTTSLRPFLDDRLQQEIRDALIEFSPRSFESDRLNAEERIAKAISLYLGARPSPSVPVTVAEQWHRRTLVEPAHSPKAKSSTKRKRGNRP